MVKNVEGGIAIVPTVVETRVENGRKNPLDAAVGPEGE
jgi:hypothetical protein